MIIISKRRFYKATLLWMAISLFASNLTGCSTAKDNPINLDCRYIIEAHLDPDNKTLKYSEKATVTNNGKGTISELFFHLYGNMYKTDDACIKVLSITDDSGQNITFEMADGDQLIHLILDNALEDSLDINFECEATLPVMEDRYGIARDGEIHLPLFYPQLSVYDENGWNTKPMNEPGDGRYANMSDYRITIEAPSDYKVACTGNELSSENIDGHTKYTYEANSRRDIIFIAHKDYIQLERTVGNTKILGYFKADAGTDYMENVMEAAAFSMEYFNRTYMVYPYETLIVTNGAWATKRSISMEYSGFITVASGDETIATYHEVAHQWFYGLVGNDENDEPCLTRALPHFPQACA